jgi:hypothetical protein
MIVEAKGSKAELQARYVHAPPLSRVVSSILIDYSLSEARATAKLAEENFNKAEMSIVCKMGETQGRCDFLETELESVRKECEEVKKVGFKTDLFEAELGKVKKEIAEREDAYVFSLVFPPFFRS